MATKKEGAQRLIDSLDSGARIQRRLWMAGAQAVVLSAAIAWFTQWQFGVAAVLVFFLLIQFAFERMSNSIQASRLEALQILGWSVDDQTDDALRHKAEKILL
ncbi:MAG: hypothetical protein QNL85_04230 [Euryarchaeota archaeon]|tara:strand:- start:1401 stop:1709 length:309 start_codon:yes stop_codon:yes gene_type:complete